MKRIQRWIVTSAAYRQASRNVLKAAPMRRAYDLAFARQPTDAKLAFGQRFAENLGLTQLCLVLLKTSEFSYVD